MEQRRVEAYLQQFESETERVKRVERIPAELAQFNAVMREMVAAVNDGIIKTPRAYLVMDAFVGDRVNPALFRSREIDYLNAALQGTVEASEDAREALRKIGRQIGTELREAERIVVQTRDIENLKQTADEVHSSIFASEARPDEVQEYAAAVQEMMTQALDKGSARRE